MKNIRFMDLDCIELDNSYVNLIASISAGPRILSLKLPGGKNLLAELPDVVTETPHHGTYRFFGGHRLWHGPENIDRTYYPDDLPVKVSGDGDALTLTQPADPVYGIEKIMRISLAKDAAGVQVDHTITYHGNGVLEGALWVITMLRAGGVGILPQDTRDTGFLANRRLTLWPYTDIRSPYIHWGNRQILVDAHMTSDRLKLGFPNPRGWLGYWVDGTLFIKRTAYDPLAAYPDFGASSQCYCSPRFIELETLSPLTNLKDGESISHRETWELFKDVPFEPHDECIEGILKHVGLS